MADTAVDPERAQNIGAAIAVCLIGLVRGLPDKAETEAAEGGLRR